MCVDIIVCCYCLGIVCVDISLLLLPILLDSVIASESAILYCPHVLLLLSWINSGPALVMEEQTLVCSPGWKLLWAGNAFNTESCFSQYAGKKLINILKEFPRVERHGRKVIVTFTIISEEIRCIETVVKGSERIRLALLRCITPEGQFCMSKEKEFIEQLRSIRDPADSWSNDSDCSDNENVPHSSNIDDHVFSMEECVKLGYLFSKFSDTHTMLCDSYCNDRVKEFTKQFIEIIHFDQVDEVIVWLSTTNKPNQRVALKLKAEHEMLETIRVVHGVPDVAIFMRECGNIVLLAEGKTKKDIDNAKDGEGQLILAMLVNYVNMGGVNSVVGFCLNPTTVSVFDIPAITDDNDNIRIRSHGSFLHSGKNLAELFMLIPYIRVATEQKHNFFKFDKPQQWI